ncbi:MAG: carbon starvation protein A [Synergistaceae bacterium]|jgi:carbon starvation protein CstA|nr:carbon starvation protein A [Synergistaceae bacterium]
MTTFLIGLVILFVGSAIYGQICVNVMKPDDRKTPAFTKTDGVDYVPMQTWKNSLINLLNIAGTGPILGPIQGILFGPVAFILIPIGNILGGAMHDYFSGMLSLRNGGMQMPALVEKYTNKAVYNVYNVFVSFLMLLVGAVFIYVPGDIAATQVLGFSGAANAPSTWVVYGVIFMYYLAATLFPIDKVIGRIYPIFGAVLLFSAIGVFGGLFLKEYPLVELGATNWKGIYPVEGTNLIPIFFITVACGIVSGFHSTQTAIISRSMTSERQGRMTFYNMMVLEGFIAMIWAAASMGAIQKGLITANGQPLTALSVHGNAVQVIALVCRDILGSAGGLLAILGVIVLPITSGDTALRSLRLMAGEFLHIDQKPAKNRVIISTIIFALVAGILYWAKSSPGGFATLWRYFAWSNQTLAVFAFAIITIYLIAKGHDRAPYMSLLPGAWYVFITTSYICNAQIGFRLSYPLSNVIGVALAVIYSIVVWKKGISLREAKVSLESNPIF